MKEINGKRIKLSILIIIIISMLILVGIVLSLTLGENGLIKVGIKTARKTNEQANVTVTSEIKERLGNGIVNILIKVESDTEIENITFPNEDGTSLTVTTDKLALAKDLKVEAGKEYPVTVKTKDGKVTEETIKIEPTMSIMVSVGDFVNYSAGNWTEADIAKLGDLYTGKAIPNQHCKFGGFEVGMSKDVTENISKFGNDDSYLYKEGWRVLKVDNDGLITIVHAGAPELYHVQNVAFPPNTEQVFKYTRNWSMYEDCSTDSVTTNYAVKGSAHAFGHSEVWEIAEKSNLRAIGMPYWLDKQKSYGPGVDIVWPRGNIGYYSVCARGVRPVVTLKANVKATAKEGQTTHITPETAWQLSLDE